jgi:hypothetical protein
MLFALADRLLCPNAAETIHDMSRTVKRMGVTCLDILFS